MSCEVRFRAAGSQVQSEASDCMLALMPMMQSLRLWKLGRALQSRKTEEAYSAVMDLGRLGGPDAVKLLIQALQRPDGIARSAARELGRMRDVTATQPLVALLARPEVGQSAQEALVHMGPTAVDELLGALHQENPLGRRRAAEALGEIGDKRAVEHLARLVESDPDDAVKTSAVTALGQMKDPRGLWVLVGILKLRDETQPDRQAALESLRQAARLAMRRIGDPLGQKREGAPRTLEAAVEQLEQSLSDLEVHPRLLGDLAFLKEGELISILKELVAASEEVSWAKLESREPLLPAYFRTYEQRRTTAEKVGEELHRRGGKPLLSRVLAEHLENYAAIKNWWGEIAA